MGKADWRERAVSAEEVIAHVQSGHRLFVHGAAATPTPLLDALAARPELERVTLHHLHLAGPVAFAEPGRAPGIFSSGVFVGPTLRKAVAEGRADFIPVFLSDVPHLFRDGILPLDAALVQLSPPDRHGLCTLGTSADAAVAAVESARVVLAEINERMPRTHGNTVVPLSRVTAFTCTDRPLHESPPAEESDIEARIGSLIAELVPDGATLQMGIGAIPDAVLARLGNKHELSVHSEMFSDGLIPLIEGGVVTNRHKTVHPGRTVTSFVAGTRRLFDFVHDNPLIEFHGCDRTNDTSLIRKNPRVCAINAALQIDLSGQVCADSLGFQIFSGIGGQLDFVRGARLSPGGKAILALPSTAAGGKVSRIVMSLNEGAGVVTTRGHVNWVVTEHGAVDLHGKNLRQRAEALIGIAHPDFRAELTRAINGIRHFSLA
ncbi:MAG: acetyl-CoA hydrolase/transferase family protein [Deltaproteobacteria bacterium]|nr:acetyl-CoA hydrolase/transferase family protein [Deltaproteobacteria bacterium]